MKIKTNIVKLLAVLAILGSLVAIAAVPASAVAASITLNGAATGSGPVGASVTVVASNFPASTVLVAKFDGATMTTSPTTITTDTSGNPITFAILIPTATAGLHLITVTDGVNVAPSTTTPNFTVQPKVVVTSPATKKGAVGTSVTVAGTGFSGAGVTADVGLIDTSVTPNVTKPLVSGVVVDSNGSFTATGTVPTFTAGAKTVSASDGAGNTAGFTDLFTVTPTLAINPTSGLPGAAVALNGFGWAASPAITVTFAGGSAVTVTPDANGVLNNVAYTIPTSATPGVKTVLGTQGTTTATTTFTVTARVLTLTPSSGPGGTKVLLGGSDMTHGGKILAGSLTFNGTAWNTADISIDSAGTVFPTTQSVPTGLAAGTYTVMATDNGVPALIGIGTFTVTKPTMVLNPTTGSINSSFTVTGSGWLPGTVSGSAVQITFSYTNTATPPAVVAGTPITTIPDGSGNIAAGITVPLDAAAGKITVKAADSKSNSATDATFTVPGSLITLNKSQGAVGTTLTVSGSGFAAYTAITVKIGNYQFLSQALSDSSGKFTYVLTVPGIAPGSAGVSATDGTFGPPATGTVASAYFVVSAAGATVQAQTASISSQLVRVWGYSGGTWSMYDPTDAAGSNLTTLAAGNGYWVNVNAACTLIYGGYNKALSIGWNLIAAPN